MSLSESFDPNTFLDGLPLTQPWVSGGSLPPVSPAPASEMTEVSPPYLHWQDHLLPLSCVSQEDNLTVLRLELETAHQLLQYQQAAIDTLSEQLTNRDLTLQHTQDELSTVQQTAHQQTSQITELGAICRDLKMQLRRQQQRVLQYRDLLKTAQVESYTPPSVPTLSESVVSFGYDSITIDAHSHKSVSKSPPVTAWSAPESIDLTGPLACYRELATIRMTTTRIRLETKSPRPTQPSLSSSQTPPVRQTEAQNLATGSTIKVELPSFTKTSS
jgi:exonuclease VII large subunit